MEIFIVPRFISFRLIKFNP